MAEWGRSSIAALWVTALGVIFAGSQLFIMAMSTSLESVNRWPVLSVEYSRSTDSYQLTAQNAGTGPALINAVNWSVDGKQLKGWKEALAHFGGTDEDLARWERLSDRVIPAGGVVRMADIKQSEAGTRLWEAWRTHKSSSNFSICYCTSLNESWVGQWASTIAGMPMCWIADRRSLRPRPTPSGQCEAGSFAN